LGNALIVSRVMDALLTLLAALYPERPVRGKHKRLKIGRNPGSIQYAPDRQADRLPGG
jgi:hypothetical protein